MSIGSFLLVLTALVCHDLPGPPPPHRDVSDNLGLTKLLRPLDFSYTGGRYNDQLFRYRLHIPSDRSNSQNNYPLIIWLHGNGESGNDNRSQLRWLELVFDTPHDPGKYEFFLLAMQCPADNNEWSSQHTLASSSRTDSHDEPITIARSLFDRIVATYPVDKDRIYLAGVSSGGTGCWEMAMRYPNIFAAVAPLGSRGGDNDRAQLLVNVPIWSFNSDGDPIDNRLAAEATVRQLSRLGGVCAQTPIPNITHDCWTAAFREYHLLDWMLAQRRGIVSSWPPGNVPLMIQVTRSAFWGQWAIGGIIGGIVSVAVFLEFRRRRRALSTNLQVR